MAIVLSYEERAGKESRKTAQLIENKYKNSFEYFLLTEHRDSLPDEMPGKGSNIAFATEEARKFILDKNNINYENVIVSAFDIDTVIYPKYFSCLTWHFLTTPNPFKTSFQPVPFYNNNIWNVPMISRVVAGSSTFWQMMQQERPEKLSTFSSHSLSFRKTLVFSGIYIWPTMEIIRLCHCHTLYLWMPILRHLFFKRRKIYTNNTGVGLGALKIYLICFLVL